MARRKVGKQCEDEDREDGKVSAASTAPCEVLHILRGLLPTTARATLACVCKAWEAGVRSALWLDVFFDGRVARRLHTGPVKLCEDALCCASSVGAPMGFAPEVAAELAQATRILLLAFRRSVDAVGFRSVSLHCYPNVSAVLVAMLSHALQGVLPGMSFRAGQLLDVHLSRCLIHADLGKFLHGTRRLRLWECTLVRETDGLGNDARSNESIVATTEGYVRNGCIRQRCDAFLNALGSLQLEELVWASLCCSANYNGSVVAAFSSLSRLRGIRRLGVIFSERERLDVDECVESETSPPSEQDWSSLALTLEELVLCLPCAGRSRVELGMLPFPSNERAAEFATRLCASLAASLPLFRSLRRLHMHPLDMKALGDIEVLPSLPSLLALGAIEDLMEALPKLEYCPLGHPLQELTVSIQRGWASTEPHVLAAALIAYKSSLPSLRKLFIIWHDETDPISLDKVATDLSILQRTDVKELRLLRSSSACGVFCDEGSAEALDERTAGRFLHERLPNLDIVRVHYHGTQGHSPIHHPGRGQCWDWILEDAVGMWPGARGLSGASAKS